MDEDRHRFFWHEEEEREHVTEGCYNALMGGILIIGILAMGVLYFVKVLM